MIRILTASAMVFAATSTYAADLVTEAPAPIAAAPVAYDWTGIYIGAQVGYGWADYDRELIGGGFSNNYDGDGWLGGVFIGYNHQYSNNVVIGVETDINYADVSGNDAGAGGTLDQTDIDWVGSLRARLGYSFDRLHVFATGGLGYARFEHTNFNAAGQTTNHTETGWTAGAGLEYAVTNSVAVRAEYRYYDFGSYSVTAPTNAVAPYSVDSTLQTATMGISFKF